jgi:hypothetical protein
MQRVMTGTQVTQAQRTRRQHVRVDVIAIIMLLTAACGGKASTGSTRPNGQITVQELDSYAACMRSRGHPGYPGPDGAARVPDPPIAAGQHRPELVAVPGCCKACDSATQ